MPIPFLILGICLIYLIFYGRDIKYKKLIIGLICCIMSAFFFDDIEIFDGVILDIFIIVPCTIFVYISAIDIDKKDFLIISISLLFSLISYFLMIYINIELSSLISPVLIFVFTTVMATLIFGDIKRILIYCILGYLSYDVINIFFVRPSIGVVTVMGVSTLMLLIYTILVSGLLNLLFKKIKWRIYKERING